jgi:hypothetical protein
MYVTTLKILEPKIYTYIFFPKPYLVSEHTRNPTLDALV